MKMKKVIQIIVLFAVLGCIVVGIAVWSVVPRQYTTTNLEDYGQYIGNYDNKSVNDFISSFFPEKLEPAFFDITYEYRAQKNDAYAFEAYLEFTIEDPQEYAVFVEQYTAGLDESVFAYDTSFTQYTVEDTFVPTSISSNDNTNATGIHIHYARIGKILCCDAEQRIVFVALGVYDGGVVTTDFLAIYFNRFGIDPLKYAE